MSSILGENIRRYREAAGLTQKELADRLKVSPSTVGMYEQGRRTPDADALAAIAAALKVNADLLLREGGATVDELIESMRGSLTANGDIMFNGTPLSQEDVDAVLEAMKLGAKIALERRKNN